MKEGKALYLFMGPPGSGKGSLSRLCVNEFGWHQLSTGNLCRQHIARQTEIGKQIDFAIKSGKLISDDLVVAMVKEWLSEILDNTQGIILDGFPRTFAQAKALERLVATSFDSVYLRMIRLVVSDEEIVARLAGRYVCKNNSCQAVYSLRNNSVLKPKSGFSCDECSEELIRRSDDAEESVRERLLIHRHHETTLLEFYRDKQYTIDEIDVARPLDAVFESFKYLVGLRKDHDNNKK